MQHLLYSSIVSRLHTRSVFRACTPTTREEKCNVPQSPPRMSEEPSPRASTHRALINLCFYFISEKGNEGHICQTRDFCGFSTARNGLPSSQFLFISCTCWNTPKRHVTLLVTNFCSLPRPDNHNNFGPVGRRIITRSRTRSGRELHLSVFRPEVPLPEW